MAGSAFATVRQRIAHHVLHMAQSRLSAPYLVARIAQNDLCAQHLPQFAQIVQYLREQLREGDVVVTMGAGNVWEIGRELIA